PPETYMRKLAPAESTQLMVLLSELRALLASGRIPELITRYHAASPRAGEHQRLLQAYTSEYLAFLDELIASRHVVRIGDELLAVARPGDHGFGDSDSIVFKQQAGQPVISQLPVPAREVRTKKDKWRRSDELVDGVDARIRRHLSRLGIADRSEPDGHLLTGRFAWAGIALEYRDELVDTDLPLAFHERAQLAVDDHGVPPAGAGQEFWIVGDMGEGEFPLLVDACDDIASNPLVYRGDSEDPSAAPEVLGSLSSVFTRCQRG
ncbi:MAG TPA: hypothetical protein VHX44_20460, partial [Planctomycetota bacterium]|nr:hypothetical protein [Planctomycetota bacterium]